MDFYRPSEGPRLSKGRCNSDMTVVTCRSLCPGTQRLIIRWRIGTLFSSEPGSRGVRLRGWRTADRMPSLAISDRRVGRLTSLSRLSSLRFPWRIRSAGLSLVCAIPPRSPSDMHCENSPGTGCAVRLHALGTGASPVCGRPVFNCYAHRALSPRV